MSLSEESQQSNGACTLEKPVACPHASTEAGDPYSLEEGKTPLSRRIFLGGLVGALGAVWAAVLAYPLFRYILPKQVAGEVVTELVACKVADLPPNSAKNVKFGAFPAIVINSPQGVLTAFIAKCTHLGCTVQYQPDKTQIYCACHGGQYDPKSGKNVGGPPPAPLPVLKAEIVKDDIVIKRA
jgi:cytochrome b6-f complex iron-sulfur subunit